MDDIRAGGYHIGETGWELDSEAPAPEASPAEAAPAEPAAAEAPAAEEAPAYDEWLLEELRDEASRRDLEGRSGLNKAELIKLLKKDDK